MAVAHANMIVYRSVVAPIVREIVPQISIMIEKNIFATLTMKNSLLASVLR